MNKKQELLALKATAKHLGTDTYIGEWLNNVLPEIERAVESDFIPDMSFSESLKQVKEKGEQIIHHAQWKADKRIRQAEAHTKREETEIKNLKMRSIEALQNAIDRIKTRS